MSTPPAKRSRLLQPEVCDGNLRVWFMGLADPRAENRAYTLVHSDPPRVTVRGWKNGHWERRDIEELRQFQNVVVHFQEMPHPDHPALRLAVCIEGNEHRALPADDLEGLPTELQAGETWSRLARELQLPLNAAQLTVLARCVAALDPSGAIPLVEARHGALCITRALGNASLAAVERLFLLTSDWPVSVVLDADACICVRPL